jgi:hypothetical protein
MRKILALITGLVSFSAGSVIAVFVGIIVVLGGVGGAKSNGYTAGFGLGDNDTLAVTLADGENFCYFDDFKDEDGKDHEFKPLYDVWKIRLSPKDFAVLAYILLQREANTGSKTAYEVHTVDYSRKKFDGFVDSYLTDETREIIEDYPPTVADMLLKEKFKSKDDVIAMFLFDDNEMLWLNTLSGWFDMRYS